ncbi:hypothetical protein lerEdw1_002260 [Lerista edwardsae]|nr:hypothetical protein lerEdw1_002260 [Lerista edwardsae]
MLPPDCAHRMVSLLTQALNDCTEHQQLLQQKLARYQGLLGDWNSQAPESPVLEESKNDNQEREPTAKEREELELLNKALEKALRVRAKFQQAPRDAAEGIKTIEKKPVASTALIQPTANSKKKVSKLIQVTAAGKKIVSSKKPSVYILKAPYRTDPDVKRAPAKRSAGLSAQASKASGKRSPRGAGTPKGQVPIKAQVASGQAESGVLASPSVPLLSARQSPSFSTPAGGGDAEDARPSLVETERGVLAPGAENPLAVSHLGEGAPGMQAAPRTSTLEAKGSQLKLPLPYKRVFSKYISLLEECRLCRTSREAVATRSRFMEKLQATFCSPPPAFSPAEVQKELGHLHEVCSLLKQFMEAETPASLGENVAWEREYESLLTVEGLQAVVSQCLDKVQQLRDALDSHLKVFPAAACSADCCPGTCAGLGRGRCWDAEALGPPPPLCYSSLKELTDLEALKLQVAILSQKLDIQEAMEAELLPLLEPGRAPEDSRASLCRSVYTLLCEGGKRFPVFVTDEELPS